LDLPLVMNDIVIPLGTGSVQNNLELRYALRSIERFASNYHRIVIAGAIPDFVTDNENLVLKIRTEKRQWVQNKEARIAYNIFDALSHPEVTDNIAMWNDDYILCKETDVTTIPFYRNRFTLAEVAEQRETCDYYKRSLAKTCEFLKALQRPNFNYDIHCPIIYNKSTFLQMEPAWTESGKSMYGLVVKSTYSNICLVSEGPIMRDLKFNNNTRKPNYIKDKVEERWIWSYSDKAFTEGVNEFLSKEYPTHSKFEKYGLTF